MDAAEDKRGEDGRAEQCGLACSRGAAVASSIGPATTKQHPSALLPSQTIHPPFVLVFVPERVDGGLKASNERAVFRSSARPFRREAGWKGPLEGRLLSSSHHLAGPVF